jgi:hypothetical protein
MHNILILPYGNQTFGIFKSSCFFCDKATFELVRWLTMADHLKLDILRWNQIVNNLDYKTKISTLKKERWFSKAPIQGKPCWPNYIINWDYPLSWTESYKVLVYILSSLRHEIKYIALLDVSQSIRVLFQGSVFCQKFHLSYRFYSTHKINTEASDTKSIKQLFC